MNDTEPIWLLDFRPSVPTRYVRRPLLTRVRTSPAAEHLRAATRSTFWPLAISSGVILALVLLTYVQALTPITGAIR
jgi:hypothetical protein